MSPVGGFASFEPSSELTAGALVNKRGAACGLLQVKSFSSKPSATRKEVIIERPEISQSSVLLNFDFGFCLPVVPQPVLTTSTYVVVWPQAALLRAVV